MIDLSYELNNTIIEAYSEAKKRGNEYLTPEHLLYSTISSESGKEIIEKCGGNINNLRKNLDNFLTNNLESYPNIDEPEQTNAIKNIFEISYINALVTKKPEIDVIDILTNIFEEEESFAVYYLLLEGISKTEIIEQTEGMNFIEEQFYSEDENDELDTEVNEEQYLRNLTKLAEEQKLDPVIGREEELERTMQILGRRLKNNVLHIGETGVGKTAITEGLAQRIIKGDVPPLLKEAQIYSLDLGGVLAGTKYRGDFEERLKNIIEFVQSQNNAILYIDEIHNIVNAGTIDSGSVDAANLLKPYLADGSLRCIGSTTHDECKKVFDKDKALARRFQKVTINEPTVKQSVDILKGLQDKYEKFHHVKYTDEAILKSVELSDKFITSKFLPDKAIDVIDEAGSYQNLHKENDEIQTVNISDIEKIISKMGNIPTESLSLNEFKKLKELPQILKTKVLGQDDAIEKISLAIKRSRAGFNDPNKPVASFLFVGPTGVGKTELSQQLATTLGIKLLRFDMSEYQEKHSVARLIGSPPGYVGYDEGGLLTDAVIKNPHAVLLLDEVEKAHPDIFNTLLQVLDYSVLTDNTGRKANFQNVIIIMTSNAGAREIIKSDIGFGERKKGETSTKDAIKKFFSPEFRNRLDGIVNFRHLPEKILLQIAENKLQLFSQKLKEKDIILKYNENVLKWLVKKGNSTEFGARELNRVIQKEIKDLLLDDVLFGKIANGGTINLQIENEKIEVNYQ